jgi:hypothetical protein
MFVETKYFIFSNLVCRSNSSFSIVVGICGAPEAHLSEAFYFMLHIIHDLG